MAIFSELNTCQIMSLKDDTVKLVSVFYQAGAFDKLVFDRQELKS